MANEEVGWLRPALKSVKRFRIATVDEDGKQADLAAIVKESIPTYLVKDDERLNLYRTEIKMYSRLLPQMEQLMVDCGEAPLWPKCLGYTEYDRLILEDLKESGYSVKQHPYDLEHCLMAARQLGKFHGLSVVLLQRGHIDVPALPDSLYSGQLGIDFISLCIKMCQKYAVSFWPESSHYFIPVLEKVLANLANEMRRVFTENGAKFKVLNHGDFWPMNMLFKYDDSTKRPVSMKMIDFQGVHYNSVATDLQHLLYTSVGFDARTRYCDQILDEYYRSLSDSVIEYGGEPPTLPSLEEIKRELEATQFLGMVLSLTALGVAMKPSVETKNVDLRARIEAVEARVGNAPYMEQLLLVLQKLETNGLLARLNLLN